MHHVLPDIYLYISSNPNAMQLVDLFGILDFTQRLDFGTLWTHSVFVAYQKDTLLGILATTRVRWNNTKLREYGLFHLNHYPWWSAGKLANAALRHACHRPSLIRFPAYWFQAWLLILSLSLSISNSSTVVCRSSILYSMATSFIILQSYIIQHFFKPSRARSKQAVCILLNI